MRDAQRVPLVAARLSEPDRVTIGVAVTVPIVVAIAVSHLPPLAFLIAMAALLWAIWLYWQWPVAALLTLALSVAVDRYVYNIAGISVTLERVMIPLITLAFFSLLAVRGDTGVRLEWGHLAILLFIGANALGALLNAPRTGDSLRLTVLIAVVTLPFWLIPNIARDFQSIKFAFLTFLTVGALQAIFGLAITALYYSTGINLGMQTDSLTGAASPYGSVWESNIFGSFVAAALVGTLSWSLYSCRGQWQSWLSKLAILTMGVAVVISLSRGAWLGALAGAGVVLLTVDRRKAGTLFGLGLAVLAALALLAALSPSDTWWSAALQRFSTLGRLLQGEVDGITLERFYTYELALRGWLNQPVIGWGAGALGQQHTYLSADDLPAWIGNLELHALYDSGVVGLLGLMSAMVGTPLLLLRSLRSTPQGDYARRGILAGLLGACVTLLVAFQASEATWLGYTWYIFGLAWAAGRLQTVRETPPDG